MAEGSDVSPQETMDIGAPPPLLLSTE